MTWPITATTIAKSNLKPGVEITLISLNTIQVNVVTVGRVGRRYLQLRHPWQDVNSKGFLLEIADPQYLCIPGVHHDVAAHLRACRQKDEDATRSYYSEKEDAIREFTAQWREKNPLPESTVVAYIEQLKGRE